MLVNVIKYSEVINFILLIFYYYYVICLDIFDNGVGFDSKVIEFGIGFFSICDRVEVFNVILEIDFVVG